MHLNLRYRFPSQSATGERYWYAIIDNNKLVRHNGDYRDFKEITPTNEIKNIEVKLFLDYPWTSLSHKVCYVNSSTDNWYDLVYHFLYCMGFEKMYINDKKDVIVRYKMYTSLYIIYALEYMSWNICIHNISNLSQYTSIVTVPRDGFCIISSGEGTFIETDNNYFVQLLEGYVEVVSNDNYKTPNMIKDIIENKTLSMVRRMYDMSIVCHDV